MLDLVDERFENRECLFAFGAVAELFVLQCGFACRQQFVLPAEGRFAGAEALFAVGPLRRGTLWESTAIPEIRVQAARLGRLLADRLRGVAPVRASPQPRSMCSL